MKDLYVVNCCRTAIGSFGGALKNTPAPDMGAIVVKEALKRSGVKPEQVDEVMFGCILTAALGQNVARQVAVKAEIPYSVPAYTVGMVCGSGMKSVIEGARAIECRRRRHRGLRRHREYVRCSLCLPTSLAGAPACSTRRSSTR
jgi:acetyl-CoA C-acetyltransferase